MFDAGNADHMSAVRDSIADELYDLAGEQKINMARKARHYIL